MIFNIDQYQEDSWGLTAGKWMMVYGGLGFGAVPQSRYGEGSWALIAPSAENPCGGAVLLSLPLQLDFLRFLYFVFWGSLASIYQALGLFFFFSYSHRASRLLPPFSFGISGVRGCVRRSFKRMKSHVIKMPRTHE